MVQYQPHESEQRFRVMADHAPVLIWMSGADGRCTYFNKPWLEFRGRTLEQESGDGWAEGVHPDDLASCLRTYENAVRMRKPFRMEYRLRRADGEFRWVMDTGVPRHETDGRFAGFVGSCVDITSHRQIEARLSDTLRRQREMLERERMLMRELDHRVRNNLAGLLGLIALYERSGRDGAELALALRGKVSAMSEVHDIISRTSGGAVGLAEMIGRIAGSAPEGVSFSGPPVMIPAGQAAAMAMILEELFTNSRKHGVLRTDEGSLRVSWSVDREDAGRRLTLVWEEDASMGGNGRLGGAPSPHAGPKNGKNGKNGCANGHGHAGPIRPGVGLRLMDGVARSDLRGDFEATLGAHGFRCILHAMFEDAPPHPEPGGGAGAGRSSAGAA